MSLGWLPDDVVLCSQECCSLGLLLTIFGLFGVRAPRRVYFALILLPVDPTEGGSVAFLGRGLLRIRSRRLGGRAVGGRGSGRFFRVSQGDEVDVHCVQYL